MLRGTFLRMKVSLFPLALALVLFASAQAAPEAWALSAGDPRSRAAEPTTTWYLAEGCTDYGFDTMIIIENPNSSNATVDISFMTDDGPVDVGSDTVPARSTVYLMPYDLLGPANFSTRVTCLSGHEIAVERWMVWPDLTGQFQEGHSSVGVTAPSKTWYLAEGSSRWGFECWVLVQNPNAYDATVNLTYMVEGGSPVAVAKTVPAESRRSFFMADDVGNVDASVKVTSEAPVIAERAMYRNNRREGHGSVGTTAPANDYYLAEGTTNWGFITYVLVQNPDAEPNEVTVTYMTQAGPVADRPFIMPPNSRRTIRVNDAHPGLDLSTKVHGSRPLIAERAMYWDSGYGEVCHDSVGLPEPHRVFYLPGGMCQPLDYERGYPDVETYTLVQNPNDVPVDISLTYIDKGYPVSRAVPANSRVTFCMSDYFGGVTTESGIVVECKTGGLKIMAENANYVMQRTIGQETIGAFSDRTDPVAVPAAGPGAGRPEFLRSVAPDLFPPMAPW